MFSRGTLLSSMNSLQNHILVAAWPKSCQHPDAWDPIWKWVVWSLDALRKGFHPMLDPDNHPWKGGLQKLKGQPLHPSGFKAVLWAVIGDQACFANVLKLPHWASHFPCWECDAQNSEGAALASMSRKFAWKSKNSTFTVRKSTKNTLKLKGLGKATLSFICLA